MKKHYFNENMDFPMEKRESVWWSDPIFWRDGQPDINKIVHSAEEGMLYQIGHIIAARRQSVSDSLEDLEDAMASTSRSIPAKDFLAHNAVIENLNIVLSELEEVRANLK